MPNGIGADVTANCTAGAIVTAAGVKESLKNTQSLLGSSVEQILNMDFVLYGSDVTTIIGSIFLMANFFIGYRRYNLDKKNKNPIQG